MITLCPSIGAEKLGVSVGMSFKSQNHNSLQNDTRILIIWVIFRVLPRTSVVICISRYNDLSRFSLYYRKSPMHLSKERCIVLI